MSGMELSFCIPTYNRAQMVRELVVQLLSCSDVKIEVVVLDNGSTDDTLSILKSIKDERLVVYSNGENRGGLYNAVNVINMARGEYLVFSIENFKSFLLRNPALACGYCEFNSNSEKEFELFSKGYEAAKNIAYKGRHPTGYFFKNRLLKSIDHVARFSDYKVVDVFPLDFILGELCLMGDGAIYHRPIFTLETGEMAAKHKSYNAPGTSKEAFFSPEGRLKISISYAKHINTLRLNWGEKKSLIVNSFVRELASATRGYQSILRDENLCAHYYMECRDVKTTELIRIGVSFFARYVEGTKCLIGTSLVNNILFRLHLILGISRHVFRRIDKVFK